MFSRLLALGILVAATLLQVGVTPASAAAPRCNGHKATIVGTEGNDRIRGTAKRDVIVARGGEDRINGRRGADLICGGAGDDVLFGGNGDDRLEGGPGADYIWVEDGDDKGFGAAGDDYLSSGLDGTADLHGGDGADRMQAYRHVGRVRMWGGPGADLLHSDNTRTVARGGDDEDLFRVQGYRRGGMQSIFLGGQGDDTLAFSVYDYDYSRDPVVIRTDLRDGTGSYVKNGTFSLGGMDALEFDSFTAGDQWIAHGTDGVETFWAKNDLQAGIHAHGGDDVVRTASSDDVVWGGDGFDTADTAMGNDVCHEVEAATNCEALTG